jgi:hypothetical protein
MRRAKKSDILPGEPYRLYDILPSFSIYAFLPFSWLRKTGLSGSLHLILIIEGYLRPDRSTKTETLQAFRIP